MMVWIARGDERLHVHVRMHAYGFVTWDCVEWGVDMFPRSWNRAGWTLVE